jgi:integrase
MSSTPVDKIAAEVVAVTEEFRRSHVQVSTVLQSRRASPACRADGLESQPRQRAEGGPFQRKRAGKSLSAPLTWATLPRRAALPASGRISDRRRRNRGGDHRQPHSGRRHPGTSPQAAEWTPRELRHSFVSLLSSAGIPIKDIAHLVGHANTRTTEKVYRKELRPVLRRGAKAMDDLFNAHRAASEPHSAPASSENQTER